MRANRGRACVPHAFRARYVRHCRTDGGGTLGRSGEVGKCQNVADVVHVHCVDMRERVGHLAADLWLAGPSGSLWLPGFRARCLQRVCTSWPSAWLRSRKETAGPCDDACDAPKVCAFVGRGGDARDSLSLGCRACRDCQALQGSRSNVRTVLEQLG